MSKDILFEIGLEEIPARFIRAAMEQLQDRTSKWLDSARITHAGVTAYATPRRLAVFVKDAAEKQEDISEEVKGPSRKIALDANGDWSKAALGFARSQVYLRSNLRSKSLLELSISMLLEIVLG